MEKKKLLLIIEAMSGGGGRHVQDLILNLDQDLFEIHLIYGKNRTSQNFIDELDKYKKNSEVYCCDELDREINLKHDMEAYRFINRKVKEISPDIVHCHSSKAGVIGRVAAKRNNIKKIFYTPHAYSFLAPEFSRNKKRLFIMIEHLLSKYATTKTFCVSNGEKEQAMNYGLDVDDKISVIYNGLPEIKLPDKEDMKKNLGVPSDSIVIGNNARLSEQKNPMLFMKIAKNKIEEDSSYHFVWVGDGPLRSKVESFIQENDLEDNIHLLGNRSDCEHIVIGYDVFLITSLYEGLPYAPIEAIRAGVPILATKVIGNVEVVINENLGILFDLNTKLKKINNLISEVSKRESFNVIKNFERYFFIDDMIDKIIYEYLNIS